MNQYFHWKISCNIFQWAALVRIDNRILRKWIIYSFRIAIIIRLLSAYLSVRDDNPASEWSRMGLLEHLKPSRAWLACWIVPAHTNVNVPVSEVMKLVVRSIIVNGVGGNLMNLTSFLGHGGPSKLGVAGQALVSRVQHQQQPAAPRQATRITVWRSR